jgi:hypothetical protein
LLKKPADRKNVAAKNANQKRCSGYVAEQCSEDVSDKNTSTPNAAVEEMQQGKQQKRNKYKRAMKEAQ